MKKILLGALFLGFLFVVSGCAHGVVEDKRAPGDPGKKRFEIQIRPSGPMSPDEVWIPVSEKVWDRCGIGESYLACAG
jgi:hypothetical protein